MSDLGKMRYFLGIEVKQGKDEISINQQKDTIKILSRFANQGFNKVCSPIIYGWKPVKDEKSKVSYVTIYKQIEGRLMYLLITRTSMDFLMFLVDR